MKVGIQFIFKVYYNQQEAIRNKGRGIMRIAVLGCGRWASFLAWYLNNIGHDVVMWGREGSGHMKQWRETRSNGMLTMPESVCLTEKLEDVAETELFVISVAAQSLREVLTQIAGYRPRGIVLCMKGIEQDTGFRLSQVAAQVLDSSWKVGVWLGPGHVQEFIRGVPNCMVLDSEDQDYKLSLVDTFSGKLIRLYIGTDLLGNEIGAAAKNVVGIAAGMLDGIGRSSMKGALMARGAREVSRLIDAMGGDPISAYGLCHLGDYDATLYSKHSHNRHFGEAFIRKEPYDRLAEGVYTMKAMTKLAAEYQVELPICSAVEDILYRDIDVETAFANLFLRSIKHEF